jgi:predicted CXXCH cytochrome family protein
MLAAGASAAPTFSHRLHTKFMACGDCHAAANSTQAADNLLPPAQVCRKCHEGMAAPTGRTTTVARFNHSQHLKAGDAVGAVRRAIGSDGYLMPAGAARAELNASNQCTACHRGFSEAHDPGRTALARMADCLVCHGRIDPPHSCAECHAEGAALKPANHTPDFLDTHTTGRLNVDKTTCAVCHGRRFSCLGCH